MRNRHCMLRNPRRGFTLIEIILVVVIILTLVAVVGPRLAGQAKSAKINTTKIAIGSVKTALLNFEVHAGRFPTTAEGLEALLKKPSGLTDDEWPDKYVDNLPKDAWNRKFQYTCPSEHSMDYDILSAGPDHVFGNDDDISNYDDIKDEQL